MKVWIVKASPPYWDDGIDSVWSTLTAAENRARKICRIGENPQNPEEEELDPAPGAPALVR